jgi:spore coat protein A
MLTRRTAFLAGAAATVGVRSWPQGLAARAATPTLTPFVDPLPLPARLRPVGVYRCPGFALGPLYQVQATQVRQKLHRDLPATTLWGYTGSYPGPTIAALTGHPVYVR